MVKLPAFDNQHGVSTGSEFMRPIAAEDSTGRALQRLGAETAQAANIVAADDRRLAERADVAARRQAALQQENMLIRLQFDELARITESAQNLAPGAPGFHRDYMAGLNERWQATLAQMPDELRPEMEGRFLRVRESLGLQTLGIEQRERRRYIQETVNARRQLLTDGITNGVTTIQNARADIDSFVAGLQLPGNAHASLTRELHTAAEVALFQRMVQTNPQAAVDALNGQVNGAMRSPNPVINHVMDAARRHGIPVDIMMAIVQGESAFNPNARGQGSSAFGLGQLIDSNWRELGMQRSDDPAVQAEATARLLARRISTLQSGGVEVTAASVWGSHFLGPAGYRAVAGADANTPIRDVLFPLLGARNYAAATANNGALLRDGMTAGQVLQAIDGYMARATTAVGARPDRPIGTTAGDPLDPIVIGDQTFNFLTRAQAPQLIGPAEQALQRLNAVRRQGQERVDGRAFLEAGEGFDPYNAQHRRAVDAQYQFDGVQQALMSGDQAAFGRVLADSMRLNHIPVSALHALRQIVVSGGATDGNTVRAYQTLSEIFENSPASVGSSQVPVELRNRVNAYRTFTLELNMLPSEAISRVTQMNSPEYQQRREANRNQANRWSRELTSNDVRYTFQSWFRQAHPTSEEQAGQLFGVFREAFRHHATNTGDREQAMALARTDISRVVVFAQVFGRRDLMEYPPERFLQPVNGTHQWVADLAARAVQSSTNLTVTPNNIMMVPDRRTAADIQAGRAPFYRVMYRGPDGVVRSAGVFQFDQAAGRQDVEQRFLQRRPQPQDQTLQPPPALSDGIGVP